MLEWFGYLLACVMTSGILGGIAVIASQVFYYLYSGTWVEASALQFFVYLDYVLHFPDHTWPTLWPWVYESDPSAWKGLHHVLEILPLSGTLIGIGIMTYVLTAVCVITIQAMRVHSRRA